MTTHCTTCGGLIPGLSQNLGYPGSACSCWRATHPQSPASPLPEAEAQKAVSWLTVCGPTAGCGAQYAGNLAQCPNCGKVNFGLPAGTPLIAAPTTQAVKVPLNPHIIFDALPLNAGRRTSFENVEDVLAAIAKRYGIQPSEGERSHD